MKILKGAGTFEVLSKTENIIESIATAARTCYQSQDKASPENDIKLVKNIIERGHTPMLEFADMTVRFSGISRACSHELVRHRIASYAQESTRYVNYKHYEKATPWSKFTLEEEEDIVELYNLGRSTTEVAKLYGCCQQAVSDLIVRNGGKLRERGDYATIDPGMFCIENMTCLKANILGLLFADGNVYEGSKGNKEISVKMKDEDYVDQLMRIWNGKFYNYESDGMFRTVIHSSSIFNDLVNTWGCVPNKSLILSPEKVSKNLPNNLLSHFIRGYFEGDGSIGWYKEYWKRQLTFTCGSRDFLVWVNKVISENCGIEERRIKESTRCFQIVYQGVTDIKKILLWMYKDFSFDLCLVRKLVRSLSICPELFEYVVNASEEFISKFKVSLPYSFLDDIESLYQYILQIQKGSYMYSSLASRMKNDDRRVFLPFALNTEICMKANMAEWRHIFYRRCDKFAHWEIRAVMLKLLWWCKANIPVIFDDFVFFTEGFTEYARIIPSEKKLAESISDYLKACENGSIQGNLESLLRRVSDGQSKS